MSNGPNLKVEKYAFSLYKVTYNSCTLDIFQEILVNTSDWRGPEQGKRKQGKEQDVGFCLKTLASDNEFMRWIQWCSKHSVWRSRRSVRGSAARGWLLAILPWRRAAEIRLNRTGSGLKLFSSENEGTDGNEATWWSTYVMWGGHIVELQQIEMDSLKWLEPPRFY